MMQALRPYPAYKESGVPWLGDVPENWEVKRVKQAAQVLRGKFTHRPRNDPSLYAGPYPFRLFTRSGEEPDGQRRRHQHGEPLQRSARYAHRCGGYR